jgi:thiol-disulfide isomerase/thioredoxin
MTHSKNQITQINKPWLIACLCAAWCDTCNSYKAKFEELSSVHPDKFFTWIDIEDQAHLIEELDIENFPTILIQHHETCLFIGTMLPDTKLLNRLISSLELDVLEKDNAAIISKLSWNLRERLLQDESIKHS